MKKINIFPEILCLYMGILIGFMIGFIVSLWVLFFICYPLV
jgi:hypothetical protein